MLDVPLANRIRRRWILALSYLMLATLVFGSWMSVNLHLGALSVIPLLFIAYYSRLWQALCTAVVSGAAIALFDANLVPGGNVVTASPAVEALILSGTLCVVVIVAERLRRRTLQNIALLESLEQAQRQARRDALTGIPNRAAILDRLRTCVREMRGREYVGVLFADLDGFKLVNDRAGHVVGDRVLKLAAERLRHATRAGDALGRIGGDEFAIVISHLNDPAEAEALAEKIEAQFADPFSVDDRQFEIGVSIGVATAPKDGLEPQKLLNVADARMYRRKQSKHRMRKPLRGDIPASRKTLPTN